MIGNVIRLTDAVNPYTTPADERLSTDSWTTLNPAKPLLVMIGGLYAMFSPFTFLSGLQAGLHVLAGALLMFVLGSATVWLGCLQFTRLTKRLTIAWGLALALFFGYAAFTAHDPADVGATVFFGAVFLVTLPITLIALGSKTADNHRMHRSGGG